MFDLKYLIFDLKFAAAGNYNQGFGASPLLNIPFHQIYNWNLIFDVKFLIFDVKFNLWCQI